ncbi:MAG: hypothetical protein L0323_10100 [Planctomycetes bacterium]|nr:hypothetical protein [Planctomycetota bacterium]
MRTHAAHLAATALGLLLAPAANAQGTCGNLTVTLSPNPAPYGAPVTVTVANNSGNAASLSSSCVITAIFSALGASPVFAPFCLTVLTPVPPGTQLSQTWDQKGNCDQQVTPGLYTVVVNAVPGGSCNFSLTIDPCTAGSISSFGAGCGNGAACGGPATLTLEDCPVIGTTVTFRLANGPANAPSALALGASNTSWMGVPLPIPIGLGCSILVSLDVILPGPMTGPEGLALFPGSIPADPALVGQTIYAEGGALSAGTFRTTNGLAVTIG